MAVNPLEEIEQREKILFDILDSSIPDHDMPVPLPKEEVLEALNQADTQNTIKHFKEELTKIIEDLLKEAEKYEAIMFSWFYDGGDVPDNATGNAYETCQANYEFLFPDLKKGSLEREKPELGGKTFYLGYLSINKVMSAWYADLTKYFHDMDYEFFIRDPRGGESYELFEIYEELFQLKLFSLLAQAYQQIDKEKPAYFFMKRHDRWPVLIVDNS